METGRDGNMVDNESVTTGSNSYEKVKAFLYLTALLIIPHTS